MTPGIRTLAKFETLYRPTPQIRCWVWVGSIVADKPIFESCGRRWSARRLSYTRHKGEIPAGLHVTKVCSTRLCVNPDHLQLKEPGGSGRPRKLSEAQVLNLRQMWSEGYLKNREVAAMNGLRSTWPVGALGRGEAYKDLPVIPRKRRTFSETGYRGVCRDNSSSRWKVRIFVTGRRVTVGQFGSIVEAAKAYDAAALKYRGDRAELNFPTS